MTTEETQKVILARIEDDVREIKVDVKTIAAAMQTKADAATVAALEGRLRVVETFVAQEQGLTRYRSGLPPWISALVALVALAVSAWVAFHVS